jgi:hypothetical protein
MGDSIKQLLASAAFKFLELMQRNTYWISTRMDISYHVSIRMKLCLLIHFHNINLNPH